MENQVNVDYNLLRRVDDEEERLISEFKEHPLFQQVRQMDVDAFYRILLQRRFLSLVFTPVYDIGIDALESPYAKAVAKEILREEYRDETSHREDLVTDLLALGVDREAIFTTRPTQRTINVLMRSLELVHMSEDSQRFQCKVLTTLRFWGEVLVSVEYGLLWPRMEALGLRRKEVTSKSSPGSVFYMLHYGHDGKNIHLHDPNLTARSRGTSNHATKLSAQLAIMLNRFPELANYVLEVEQEIVAIKSDFYSQFLTG